MKSYLQKKVRETLSLAEFAELVADVDAFRKHQSRRFARPTKKRPRPSIRPAS